MSKEQNEKLVVVEETIPNPHGPNTRNIYRNKKNGRFLKTTERNAQRSMRDSQKLLLSKDATGKTLAQRIDEHIAKTALQCGPEDLNAAVKARELLDSLAFSTVKKSMTEEREVNSGIRVVIVTPSPNIVPMPDRKALPSKPSFIETIDAEIITNEREPKESKE
jgi:hypothetical protein